MLANENPLPEGASQSSPAAPDQATSGTSLAPRLAVLAVLGIFLSLLMGALDNFVVLTALPNIVTDLKQPSGVTFVVSSYLITTTVAIPIFAKLSDILSRRNIFILGLAIFIVGSALAGLSQTLNQLILFRGIQGFGAGGFFPVGISIVAALFSGPQRARITGVLSGVFGIATIAGPLLGSFIVDNTTWRWIFYINIPIGLAGIAVLFASLGPLRPQVRGHFDVPGAALLSAWVGALMFALFEVSEAGWSWTDPRIIGLLATTVVGFAAFIVWSFRAAEPIVPLRLFGKRVVAASGTVAFLRGFAIFSLFTFIAVLVGIVIQKGGTQAADTVRDVLYFLVIPMILASFIGGQALTRVPYRPVVFVGVALAAVGTLDLSLTTTTTPLWSFSYGFLPTGGLELPLMPIGAGAGLTFAATITSVQYEVPVKDVGAATGLVQFLQSLGAAAGVSVLASVQQWRYQALAPTVPVSGCAPPIASPACFAYFRDLHSAVITSFTNVFTVMFVLLVVAVGASLFLTGRIPTRGPRPPTESA